VTDPVYRPGEPFAQVLKIVGRGPNLSRPLALEEAEAAMAAILDGAADELQVGAFLLTLRTRGETAPEIAGMVRAARARLPATDGLSVDLDWPSYADAHRQLPWFLLAARLLASAGVRILLHGVAGLGPAGTREGLAALGLVPAASLAAAARGLDRSGLAYLPLEVLSPELARLLALKPRLGVRTAVNSLVRALDPAGARAQLLGVFHPPYLRLQAEAKAILGGGRAAILKGGGGEAQRNPEKPCRVLVVADGAIAETVWPALLEESRHPWREEPLEPARLAALWDGALELPAAVAAVTGTAALALHLLGRAADPAAAQAMAEDLWAERPRLGRAA
jgi:anthranilate phosphoribosyltransferase